MSDQKPSYQPAHFSPKGQFIRKRPLVNTLGELVHQDWFQESLTYALAEMQSNMAAQPTPQQSWDAHNQMVGAKRFITTLLHLPEVNAPKSVENSAMLKY